MLAVFIYSIVKEQGNLRTAHAKYDLKDKEMLL